MPSSRVSTSSSGGQELTVRLCKHWTKQQHPTTILFLGAIAALCLIVGFKVPVHSINISAPTSAKQLLRIDFYLSGLFVIEDPYDTCGNHTHGSSPEQESLEEFCEKLVGDHVDHHLLFQNWCAKDGGPPKPLTCADITVFETTGLWTKITTILDLGVAIPASLFFAHSAHNDGRKSCVHVHFDYFVFCLLVLVVFVETMSVMLHLCFLQFNGADKDRAQSAHVDFGWAFFLLALALLAQYVQIVVFRSTCPNVKKSDELRRHRSSMSAQNRLEPEAYGALMSKLGQAYPTDYGALMLGEKETSITSINEAPTYKTEHTRTPHRSSSRREHPERTEEPGRSGRSERRERSEPRSKRPLSTKRKSEKDAPHDHASSSTSSGGAGLARTPRADRIKGAVETPTQLMKKLVDPADLRKVTNSSAMGKTWDSLQAQLYKANASERGVSVPRIATIDKASRRPAIMY